MTALARPLATLALALAPAIAHAQSAAVSPGESSPSLPPAPRQHALIADLGLHVIGVAYERVVHRWLSAQIAADYYSPWTVQDNALGLPGSNYALHRDLWGIGVRARVFVFLLGDAPEGLFVSPFAQAFYASASNHGTTGDGGAWAVGLSVGYSLVLWHALILRLGVGLQYHRAVVYAAGENQGFEGVFQHVDIQAGWAF